MFGKKFEYMFEGQLTGKAKSFLPLYESNGFITAYQNH
jgi:hypothetical protein